MVWLKLRVVLAETKPRPRYKKTRYDDSEEQMKKYTTLMSAYGVGAGIDFKFHGQVANTLDAHRLIQYFQEEMGAEVADKIVNCTTARRQTVFWLDAEQGSSAL